MGRALIAIIGRDLRRMARQRGRLVSAMVRPLIWLLVIGSGFEALLGGGGLPGYRQFMVPGLMCMVLLFGALLASLSMVYDQESGVMRMLIVAPFARYLIVLARTLSASIVGLVQVGLWIVVLYLLGYLGDLQRVDLLALGLVATSLCCASLGTLIAVYSKGLEDFAVIMNFVIFPMFFLSGALYPIAQLPPVLRAVAWVNPLSYGVDVLKHAFGASGLLGADFPVAWDLLALGGSLSLSLALACWRFSQAPVFERLARILSAPRRR